MRELGQQPSRARLCASCAAVIFLVLSVASQAQEPGKPVISPGDLVRLTVRNEVAASDHSSIKHMFRSRKQTTRETQTHLYVETSQAMAGMLVAVDGRPLTAQQQQTELNRLYGLAGNPDALRKKRARESQDEEHTLRILRALPDAFRYEYDGVETGTQTVGGEGAQLVRLKFAPNPSYAPPSRVEQVLEGMRGSLLIDVTQHRIACIEGTLFKEVSFGWGIIGRLDQGGHFHVEQANVGDDSWEITEMNLNVTGKLLLFKNLNIASKEVFGDFQRVPNTMTFAQGVDMLKTEKEKLAQSGDLDLPGKSPQ
jgi:hypothetical protein